MNGGLVPPPVTSEQEMQNREERIRKKAHALWLADGEPEGRADYHWAEAERQVFEEDRAAGLAQQTQSTSGGKSGTRSSAGKNERGRDKPAKSGVTIGPSPQGDIPTEPGNL
jgi:hypothetical protein